MNKKNKYSKPPRRINQSTAQENTDTSPNTSIVYGRNPVLEILKSSTRSINKIYISQTAHGAKINEIVQLAKQKGIAFHCVNPDKLDKFSEDSQGIIAEVSPKEYVEPEEIISKALASQNPLIVLLCGIYDPHNLGAIIRNCVAFGASGVIIPKWHSAAINETVAKASAGAVEHILISLVSNLNNAIALLKKNNFWIVGAENGYDDISQTNIPSPRALVMGNESEGLGKLVKKNCDIIISIAQKENISSLNVSCASAIILYELTKK
ncbi:MAG: 23S rRNA (guanosine(2251)-2'-O)-methyltransferase RlmB [Elusimicrobiota bacterium]|jgi:23S rRNA (guanosine2251-2'-O)-methyltransferase|nr:23S rRNA (guanosine(2251)-2'-O)-methyltransferase RlmB [Elusimicrobiota bacterium]